MLSLLCPLHVIKSKNVVGASGHSVSQLLVAKKPFPFRASVNHLALTVIIDNHGFNNKRVQLSKIFSSLVNLQGTEHGKHMDIVSACSPTSQQAYNARVCSSCFYPERWLFRATDPCKNFLLEQRKLLQKSK